MELEGFLSFFEMDRKETFQLENLFPDSGSNLELKKVTECEVKLMKIVVKTRIIFFNRDNLTSTDMEENRISISPLRRNARVIRVSS